MHANRRFIEAELREFDTFRDLVIPTPLIQSLERMSFRKPTPVQKASIPAALKGKDILGTAQTGTGKTAAFGIPLLGQLYTQPGKLGLILAPTRELAAQIHTVMRKMSKGLRMRGTLFLGGESFSRQMNEFERGVDYIIATPGRLNDHLRERTVNLSKVSFVVLDEVDRMLDMGFAPQIKEIMRYVPKHRQTLLFSATLPRQAADMAKNYLNDPLRVAIDPVENTLPIEERLINTSIHEKANLIVDEMKNIRGKTLIFTRTKSRTERVARVLGKSGHKVVNLHGGRTQGQRKRALNMFRAGTHPIMVATDIAGRGIDISDIQTVINYDVPQCREDYIHRIGRTARNGKAGKAISFVTPEDQDADQILLGKKKEGFRGKKTAGKSKRKSHNGRPSKKRGKFRFSDKKKKPGKKKGKSKNKKFRGPKKSKGKKRRQRSR